MKNKMDNNDTQGLTLLGKGSTKYPTSIDEVVLETFPNKTPDRDYLIRFDCLEGTSNCRLTGQPDFWVLKIDYIPDRRCIETKSLKLYLYGYRNERTFFEPLVNKVRDDLVKACQPKHLKVYGVMNVRGGIGVECVSIFKKTGYKKPNELRF